MPIYEFVCSSCGHQFETICSLAEAENVECSACRSKSVKKIPSAGSIKVGSRGASASPLPAAPPACGRSGFS